MKELLNIFNYSLLIYFSGVGSKPTNPNLCSPDGERQTRKAFHAFMSTFAEGNEYTLSKTCLWAMQTLRAAKQPPAEPVVAPSQNQDMFHQGETTEPAEHPVGFSLTQHLLENLWL